MRDRIQVALVDDHPLFREGVAYTLATQPDIEVVGQGGTAEEAVRLAERLSPDLLLLDLDMPGGGLNAALAVARACPAVKVLMLTVSGEEDHVRAAFDAGVLCYILKGVSARELVRIVRDAHAGICYLSPSLAADLPRSIAK